MKNKLRDRTVDMDYLLAGKQPASDDSDNTASEADEKSDSATTSADNEPAEKSAAKVSAASDDTNKKTEEEISQSRRQPNKSVLSRKPASDDKVKFMTYLNVPMHQTFTMLYVDVKPDARATTGKALSQSEMVEVLIQYAADNCQNDTSDLLAIAENIINKRPNK